LSGILLTRLGVTQFWVAVMMARGKGYPRVGRVRIYWQEPLGARSSS